MITKIAIDENNKPYNPFTTIDYIVCDYLSFQNLRNSYINKTSIQWTPGLKFISATTTKNFGQK